jgi:hypothetical protein
MQIFKNDDEYVYDEYEVEGCEPSRCIENPKKRMEC